MDGESAILYDEALNAVKAIYRSPELEREEAVRLMENLKEEINMFIEELGG